MSKPIIIDQNNWDGLLDKLLCDYPKSTVLIREKRKKVIGFLERSYRWYDTKNHMYHNKIYLDFFDDGKKTFFMLKYGEFLEKENRLDE